jgi:SAM-dependent methyltransferase
MNRLAQTRSSSAAVPLARKADEWRQQLTLLIKSRSPFARSDFRWLTGVIAEYDGYTRAYAGKPLQSCRALEIGFGQRAYRLLAIHAAGADVTGCDLDQPILATRDLAACLRANGVERGLKSAVRYLLFDLVENRRLQRFLSGQSGRPVEPPRERLIVADAADPAFWARHPGPYDLIYSEDVFEHIPGDDLRAVTSCIAEHLSAAGIALIRPMIWTGIKGGHHVEYYGYVGGPPPARVPPWDHLRAGRFPANTYLNRLSRRDYRQIFRECLEIVEEREVEPSLGRELLTPELRGELGRYDDDELLSNKITFVLRRKRNDAGPRLPERIDECRS